MHQPDDNYEELDVPDLADYYGTISNLRAILGHLMLRYPDALIGVNAGANNVSFFLTVPKAKAP